jgi:hypothetical protein
MVTHTGTPLRADAYRPVNLPEPVQVEEGPGGLPRVVRLPRRQKVDAVEDRWRLDDEWWRREPVVRLYCAVRLASGQRLELYKDLVTGAWYKQAY